IGLVAREVPGEVEQGAGVGQGGLAEPPFPLSFALHGPTIPVRPAGVDRAGASPSQRASAVFVPSDGIAGDGGRKALEGVSGGGDAGCGLRIRRRQQMTRGCRTSVGAVLFIGLVLMGVRPAVAGPKVYVGLFKDDAVAVLDPEGQRVQARIAVPKGPH